MTEACFICRDDNEDVTVHITNGRPRDVYTALMKTFHGGKRFMLPSFVAGDFASAFISANKTEAGQYYVTNKWNIHRNVRYLYTLNCNNGVLVLKVEAAVSPQSAELKPSRWRRSTLYYGPLHRWLEAKGVCRDARKAMPRGRKISTINAALNKGQFIPVANAYDPQYTGEVDIYAYANGKSNIKDKTFPMVHVLGYGDAENYDNVQSITMHPDTAREALKAIKAALDAIDRNERIRTTMRNGRAL